MLKPYECYENILPMCVKEYDFEGRSMNFDNLNIYLMIDARAR